MIAQEALNNADTAEYVIGEAIANDISGNVDRIPDNLKHAKQLSKDTSDSIRDVNQANHQLDTIDKTLPDIDNRVRALDQVQQQINGSGNSLYDKIEDLKKKIAHARELANSIKIGLTFFPNTTLELKNPESLPGQTTSTKISLYFRTQKANGFLLYLGNENRTNTPRAKTVSLRNLGKVIMQARIMIKLILSLVAGLHGSLDRRRISNFDSRSRFRTSENYR